MTGSDRPAVIAPPPLVYAGGFALVLGLHWLWPMPIADYAAVRWTGVAALGAGIALNAWGAHSMIRARTPINPYHPVKTIVSSGAFRISRNPLYVGLHVVFLGLSLLLNSVWGLVVLVPVLLVVHHGVILPEEQYLESRFGEPYRRYRERVGRYF
jgi:protein-S-isoprenylcysteine O-methyltransferase Ste14